MALGFTRDSLDSETTRLEEELAAARALTSALLADRIEEDALRRINRWQKETCEETWVPAEPHTPTKEMRRVGDIGPVEDMGTLTSTLLAKHAEEDALRRFDR